MTEGGNGSLENGCESRMYEGEFHINWRHLWGFSPTNWRHAYQPATSPVCYFVHRVGLVGCAPEFLGRIGSELGLGLVFSARCNIYISRLCYDVSVRLSARLSVTEVHWCIIANLGFKFRSQFTAYRGRGACRHEGRDHHREEWRDHLALC